MKSLSQKALSIPPSATLSIGSRAKQMKKDGINVVNFGVGEPDFDTPINIKNAAKRALDEGYTKYTPSSGTIDLKNAICAKFKNDNGLEYKPENIVVSNGAKQALYNTFFTLLNEGDEVLLPSPYWVSYTEMAKACGGKVVPVESKIDNNLKATVAEFSKKLSENTKVLLINSPCNPTGAVYSEKELYDIANFAVKNDLYVIADEIYEKLIYEDGLKHISIASFGKEIFERTVTINGVSKSYSMTGFRIGYSASSAEIAGLISNFQSHITSGPNSIAQKAAIEAISGDQSETFKMRDEFKKRRDFMAERINQIEGVSCVKPHGAFYVMINMENIFGKEYNGIILNDKKFSEILLEEEKVAVVPCESFGASNYIRLSYALSIDDIKLGLERIENFIKKIMHA